MSSGAWPGEALRGLRREPGAGRVQANTTSLFATGVVLPFTGWVKVRTEVDEITVSPSRWVMEHDMSPVWVASCQTQRAEPQQPPAAQLRQAEAAQGTGQRCWKHLLSHWHQACCKWYNHFNYTNCIKQSSCWNHGGKLWPGTGTSFNNTDKLLPCFMPDRDLPKGITSPAPSLTADTLLSQELPPPH